GTPNFERTYREYLKTYGLPDELNLLLMLLDLNHEQDVVRVLQSIQAGLGDFSIDEKSLLRIRLRNLEMSTEHDRVADVTTELLAQLWPSGGLGRGRGTSRPGCRRGGQARTGRLGEARGRGLRGMAFLLSGCARKAKIVRKSTRAWPQ